MKTIAAWALILGGGGMASLEVSKVTGYDEVPGPIRHLPFWLAPEDRRVGKVIYDDGEGFKHDKGKMAYTLGGKETWKGVETLTVGYAYQGMQEHDNWQLSARYDQETGYLLWAAMSVRMTGAPHVTFELTLVTKRTV
jgi:hypothetical protein